MELPATPSLTPRCGPVGKSRRSRWRAASLIAVHLAVLIHIAHWKVTGRTVTPLEPSEAMQTLELGYLNAGFILFALAILATLIVGRFFCGWACHLVAYQDLCAWILGKFGLKPRPFRSRLLVLVPLGAAFYMFFWPSIARAWMGAAAPEWVPRLTTDSYWRTFPGLGIAILSIVIDGFLIVWFLGAKGFCTYGCPYGALFGIADRLSPGKILVNDDCEGCGHCTATCTSNVRVHLEVAQYGMVVDPGCMKCLDCVDVCPKHALSFGFGRPAVGAKSRGRRAPARTYDLTWAGELAVAAVFVGALYAFRDLYNLIPFLLALGLAAITAFLAVVAWRMVRAREFRLQAIVLRRGGRWTPAGIGALVLLPLVFAFVGHSAYVHYETAAGEALVVAAKTVPKAERGPEVEAALRHLLAAERAGLVETAGLQHYLGNAYRQVERWDDADRHLRRAVDLEPDFLTARMDLATVMMFRRDLAGARAQLAAIVRASPESEVDRGLQHLAAERLAIMNAAPPETR